MVRELNPAYFALVMATGIVSIAADLLGMPGAAWILFYLNGFAYLVLWGLTLWRLAAFPPRIFEDLKDYARGPGFLTAVAGTCVLGSQFVVLADDYLISVALWWFGFALWLVLIYSFFAVIVTSQDKPSLADGISGAWLLVTVSTQSVSVLGTLVAGHLPFSREEVLFGTLALYLLGAMLYILTALLIYYRLLFLKVAPRRLDPTHWIDMGAVAITTLAGATLLLSAPEWGFLQHLAPFLTGFTLFFWVTGTWWIPLLFILGAWRHLVEKVPFSYDPRFWSMVFPMGMYTACTFNLAQALDLPRLKIIPEAFIYVALTAWVLTAVGLLKTLFLGTREAMRN